MTLKINGNVKDIRNTNIFTQTDISKLNFNRANGKNREIPKAIKKYPIGNTKLRFI